MSFADVVIKMLANGVVVFVLALAVDAAQSAEQQFEGLVVRTTPLEVKALQGQVVVFSASTPETPLSIKPGDFVRVVYTTTPKSGAIYTKVEWLGATITATVKEIAADKSALIARTQQRDRPDNEINVPLQSSTRFQPLVAAMRVGDGIKATYVHDKGVNALQSLEWQSVVVDRGWRWGSLLIAALTLFLVALLFTAGHPTHLFLGADNRYSSSIFQTVLWFWVVMSAYLAIVSHRIMAAGWHYVGGVDIPQNLLVLSGISVLTFAAAKAITTGKVQEATRKGQDAKPSAAAPKPGDLVNDDLNRTDLGDLQMVVITSLAVIIFAITAVEFMAQIEFRRVVTMPDVDATLLAIFGLAQAAYLGKKAAGEAGTGLTLDQAQKGMVEAAASVKEDAQKASAAASTAATNRDIARTSTAAAAAASTRVDAQREADKVETSVNAARDAEKLASAAAKAAETRAAEAKSLADRWSKEPGAPVSLKASSDAAQSDAAAARKAADEAKKAADEAEQQLTTARTSVAQKP